jgi:hypothetical protein
MGMDSIPYILTTMVRIRRFTWLPSMSEVSNRSALILEPSRNLGFRGRRAGPFPRRRLSIRGSAMGASHFSAVEYKHVGAAACEVLHIRC